MASADANLMTFADGQALSDRLSTEWRQTFQTILTQTEDHIKGLINEASQKFEEQKGLNAQVQIAVQTFQTQKEENHKRFETVEGFVTRMDQKTQ